LLTRGPDFRRKTSHGFAGIEQHLARRSGLTSLTVAPVVTGDEQRPDEWRPFGKIGFFRIRETKL
jgi:hypothetical protein